MVLWCVFVAVCVIGLLLITSYVRAVRKRRAEAQREKLAKLVAMRDARIRYPRGQAPPPGPMLADYADQLRSYPRNYRKPNRGLGPKYYRSKVNGKRVWILPELRTPPKK